MRSFLATVALGSLENWEIHKKKGFWGTPKESPKADRAAVTARRGDVLFLWRTDGRTGLFARAEILGQAARPSAKPWPDPDRYSYVFPIKVTDELDVAIGDEFRNSRQSMLFHIASAWLDYGFWNLPMETSQLMNVALHRKP